MSLTKVGLGRAIVAAMTVCVAAVALSGCSYPGSEASTELALRGFTEIKYVGSAYGGVTDGLSTYGEEKFFLSVGTCRGSASVELNDITARFADRDGDVVEFEDASASMVTANEAFSFCTAE